MTRQDTIKGGIDKISGRVRETFGKLTRSRSATAKGKAARVRGAGRSAKGRIMRRERRGQERSGH